MSLHLPEEEERVPLWELVVIWAVSLGTVGYLVWRGLESLPRWPL